MSNNIFPLILCLNLTSVETSKMPISLEERIKMSNQSPWCAEGEYTKPNWVSSWHQPIKLSGQMEESFLQVKNERQEGYQRETTRCSAQQAMLSHNPWLWASLTDAEMCWGPTTAETSLEDLGIQNKTFGATVPKTSEDGKPTRDDLLSVTWASAEFPNQWLAVLPLLSTNFSEMLWQFVWCQRVSVWLRGMCLHLNIWGLIINIRNFF